MKDRLLEYARLVFTKKDDLLKDVLGDRKIDCGKGCAFCCFGVPLWVSLVEATLIEAYLNQLPIRERKEVHLSLRRYARLYREESERVGYSPKGLVQKHELDTDKLSLACGLGMNDVPCPFLDTESMACRVYDARPTMCRLTLFTDKSICEKDWREPLSFLWRSEIEPFIESVKGEFYKHWYKEEKELRENFKDIPIDYVENTMLFLPERLSFDPIKKKFKLRY